MPASDAEKLEAVMERAAGELFAEYPDIMHQLTVTLNPNVLMAAGVRVVRAFQRAGEFMITFPRSYHAGFNQGFNFAEAVNFLPPDWVCGLASTQCAPDSTLYSCSYMRTCCRSLVSLLTYVLRTFSMGAKIVLRFCHALEVKIASRSKKTSSKTCSLRRICATCKFLSLFVVVDDD